jgi:hypothetical protein
MTSGCGASFEAALHRHHPELPVYILVPGEIVARFERTATFVVQASVAGRRIGRRTVKPWGDGRWFMELTKAQCARLGVGAGDVVEVDLVPAPELPEELEAALDARGLRGGWARLTPAERRAIAEEVFAARRADTRARRIERVLARLEPAP